MRFFYAKKVDVTPAPYRMSSTCSIPHYVVCFYKLIGIFLFGCAISQSITNIGKFTIGRLRPHFLDVCKPVPSKYNCTNANNFYVYVENVVCTGTDQHQLENSRYKHFFATTYKLLYQFWSITVQQTSMKRWQSYENCRIVIFYKRKSRWYCK